MRLASIGESAYSACRNSQRRHDMSCTHIVLHQRQPDSVFVRDFLAILVTEVDPSAVRRGHSHVSCRVRSQIVLVSHLCLN